MSSGLSEQDWYERIKRAYLDQNFRLAERLMDRALEETESSPMLLEIAGMMAYERRDFHESIRLIEAAMFEVSLSISAQMTLASAWLRIGNRGAAETTLSFLVEIIERIPCSMLSDLTRNVVEIGRDDLAIAICQEAFRRHPDDDNAAFAVGFYMFRNGQSVDVAQRYMRIATQLDPACVTYRLNLAVVCASVGQWQDAYLEATQVSTADVRSFSCPCLVNQVKEIYLRFDDFERVVALEDGLDSTGESE